MTAGPVYGEVVTVTRLTPGLVRLVFGGPGLDGFTPVPWTDAYVNAQFLPEAAPYAVPFSADLVRQLPRELQPYARRYTVRRWDARRRELTVDVVVHGDVGVAGRWAQSARPGDRLQFKGPSGAYAPDPQVDWHLMVGDASALPAIAASLEQVPSGRPVVVVLEVEGPAYQLGLTCPGALELHWVHSTGADDLLACTVGALTLPASRGQAFVHGEAAATRLVRAHLLRHSAVQREDLSASPYWRQGLTDEQWRSVKAAWQREVELDVPA